MADPVSQLLVIVGVLVVALILTVRWGSAWKARALEAEYVSRFWHSDHRTETQG